MAGKISIFAGLSLSFLPIVLSWSAFATTGSSVQENEKRIASSLDTCAKSDSSKSLSACADVISSNAPAATKARAFALRGKLLATDNPESAIADFNKSIQLDPNASSASVYVLRGTALSRTGKQKAALADFSEAVRREPAVPVHHLWLAGSLRDAGENDRALAEYGTAIRLDRTRSASFRQRADLLSDLGRFSEALADLDQARALSPNSSSLHFSRANILIRKNEDREALGELTEAVRLEPSYADAYSIRSGVRARLGLLEEALEDANRGVALAPDRADARGYLAYVYARRGALERADEALSEAVRLGGAETPSVIRNRGEVSLIKGLPKAALDDFSLVIARQPQNALARLGRLAALRMLDDPNGASSRPVSEKTQKAEGALQTQRRVALVIGNGQYRSVPVLLNPVRDADSMAELFRSAKFDDVIVVTDASATQMRQALREFSQRANNADIAVVYYAGHGIEIGGRNFLIPVDARLARDVDTDDEAVSLDRVLQLMAPVKQLKLIILDACRENPFATGMRRTTASRNVGRGLAKPEIEDSDVLIAYATSPNSVAADGDGQHSPFAEALLHHIVTPGLDIRQALGAVRDDVRSATRRAQQPFISGSLGGGTLSLVPARADEARR